MLQQTRVETVVPYYARFLARYPTVERLADAAIDDVLAAWSGLGYYRRARLLHAGATHVARALGGVVPTTAESLREVPGIGRYTAGAIASIAHGEATPLVDGNVARVLSRWACLDEDPKSSAGAAALWDLAAALVARDAPGDWNQALMELGATVCTPRDPRCEACPVADACAARRVGREREIPAAAKRKASPVVALVAIVARDRRGRVLLAQRGPEGTFGGLWEPPMAEAPAEPPIDAEGVRVVGRVRHVLSHRRLEVEVKVALRARAPRGALGGYERFAWTSPESFGELGLATFARKVLAAAGCG